MHGVVSILKTKHKHKLTSNEKTNKRRLRNKNNCGPRETDVHNCTETHTYSHILIYNDTHTEICIRETARKNIYLFRTYLHADVSTLLTSFKLTFIRMNNDSNPHLYHEYRHKCIYIHSETIKTLNVNYHRRSSILEQTVVNKLRCTYAHIRSYAHKHLFTLSRLDSRA